MGFIQVKNLCRVLYGKNSVLRAKVIFSEKKIETFFRWEMNYWIRKLLFYY